MAAIFLLAVLPLRASHILGGELSYVPVANSPNTYHFTFKAYIEPNTISLSGGPTEIFRDTIGSGIPVRYLLSPTDSFLVSTGCNSSVKVFIFEGTHVLPALPPSGFILYWETCCRANGIDNLYNSAGSTFYIATLVRNVPGATTPSASPEFNGSLMVTLPSGIKSTVNFAATQADGDSLYYELVDARGKLSSTISNVVYKNGYSSQMPFGVNVPTSINHETGLLTVTNPQLGDYAVVVRVSAYKNGVLSSRIFRDYSIAVIADYSGVQAFHLSSSNIQINGGSISQQDSTGIKIKLNEGGSIAANLKGKGIFLTPNQVFMSISGNPLDTSNGGNCIGANCPKLVGSNATLAGTDSVSAVFTFLSDTSSTSATSGTKYYSYLVELAFNQACNLKRITHYTIQIELLDLNVFSQDTLYVCQGDSVQAAVTGDTTNLNWLPALGVSDVSSAHPWLKPLQTTTYKIYNQNNGSYAQTTVVVNPRVIVPLQSALLGLSLPTAHQSKPNKWFINGVFNDINKGYKAVSLSGYYTVEITNTNCENHTDTVFYDLPNQVCLHDYPAVPHEDFSQLKTISFELGVNNASRTISSMYIINDLHTTTTANAIQVEIREKQGAQNLVFTGTFTDAGNHFYVHGLNLQISPTTSYVVKIGNENQPNQLGTRNFPLIKPAQFPFSDVNGYLKASNPQITMADNSIKTTYLPMLNFDIMPSVGIEEWTASSVFLYPNPTRNFVGVSGVEAGEIQIFNQAGSMVLSTDLAVEKRIDIAFLPAGLYTYKISCKSQVIFGKVSKMN